LLLLVFWHTVYWVSRTMGAITFYGRPM